MLIFVWASDSGVGDHGKKGIEAFIKQHRCNQFCNALHLDPINPVVAADTSSDDDEDDEELDGYLGKKQDEQDAMDEDEHQPEAP